jgi:hypothetical protein
MQNINPAYSGSSSFTLTDGLFGTRQSYDRWVGTLGEDYVVELDLKEKTQVKYLIKATLVMILVSIIAGTLLNFIILR